MGVHYDSKQSSAVNSLVWLRGTVPYGHRFVTKRFNIQGRLADQSLVAGVGFGRVVRYPLFQYYHQDDRLHDMMRIIDRISIHATCNMFVFPLPSPSINQIGLPHCFGSAPAELAWGSWPMGVGIGREWRFSLLRSSAQKCLPCLNRLTQKMLISGMRRISNCDWKRKSEHTSKVLRREPSRNLRKGQICKQYEVNAPIIYLNKRELSEALIFT